MKAARLRWQRFARFNLVGLLGAALQLLLIWTLTAWSRVPVAAATAAAVELVLLHNFAWHERFTWSDRRFSTIRQRLSALGRFHLGNGLISIAGNTAIMYFLVERFALPVLPSAVAAIIVCSLANFVVAER